VESFATTIPAPARSFGQITSIQISTSAVPSSTQAIDEEVEQLLASGGSLPECSVFKKHSRCIGRNYSITAMHERYYLQETTTDCRTPSRKLRTETPAQTTRRIPEEGEIQQYFDEWETKSKSTQLNKLPKPKGRADKLDIRLRELVAKRRNIRQ